MKKVILKILSKNKQKYRKAVFDTVFSDLEKTAMINALWRRSFDSSTENVYGDGTIKYVCAQLAKELLS